MENITLYSLNESLEVVEHGVVTIDQAMKILDQYAARQIGRAGSVEEVLSASVFGFSVGDDTFIEIAMETESRFRVKLEMPESKRFLFIPITSIYQKEIAVEGLGGLRDIVAHFFAAGLDEFKSYFQSRIRCQERYLRIEGLWRRIAGTVFRAQAWREVSGRKLKQFPFACKARSLQMAPRSCQRYSILP